MSVEPIRRVERSISGDRALYCPYCGALVLSAFDPDADFVQSPCAHTLFIAHDDGFEHLDARAALGFSSQGVTVADDDITDGSGDSLSIDEATDLLRFPEAIKFAYYEGAPSLFGSYVGFAPLDD